MKESHRRCDQLQNGNSEGLEPSSGLALLGSGLSRASYLRSGGCRRGFDICGTQATFSSTKDGLRRALKDVNGGLFGGEDFANVAGGEDSG
jgi:hypothetical protein